MLVVFQSKPSGYQMGNNNMHFPTSPFLKSLWLSSMGQKVNGGVFLAHESRIYKWTSFSTTLPLLAHPPHPTPPHPYKQDEHINKMRSHMELIGTQVLIQYLNNQSKMKRKLKMKKMCLNSFVSVYQVKRSILGKNLLVIGKERINIQIKKPLLIFG